MVLFLALSIILTFDSYIIGTCCFEAVQLGTELKHRIQGQVLTKGSLNYEKRRLVHNGLCTHLYPDWIVVPVSTKDVSETVRTAVKHNVSLSVRSGGHSFTCTGIKQGKTKTIHHEFPMLYITAFLRWCPCRLEKPQ